MVRWSVLISRENAPVQLSFAVFFAAAPSVGKSW